MVFKMTSLVILTKQRVFFRILLGLVAVVFVAACSEPVPNSTHAPTATATLAPMLTASATLPTPTLVPPESQQLSGSIIAIFEHLITITEVATSLPDYDRGDWRHWRDEDGDCQNTRHEVLIEESLRDVTFKDDKRCQVATGEWLAPYSNVLVTDATTLDVDHMVPLKNAHDSGGWAWDKDKKADYANETGYGNHLIAVTASANRQKGAAGPEKWKPLNKDYWCDYAISWVQIKARWGLSATEDEWAALQEMLQACDSPPPIEASP